ncbi:MAG: hypothetical protein AAF704_05400 [Cyanobacteria bacterium P01_D01_bin.123]
MLVSSNSKKNTATDGLGNLSQIRDILFGQQMREFGDRFARIEADLAQGRQDMLERIEQVRESMVLELRAAIDATDKKFNSLSVETREARADLEQELYRSRDKLSNTLAVLDEALDRQTSSIRTDLLRGQERLQDDMRELKANIVSQLEDYVANLQDAKVSRDAMAELLFEMGVRLKGLDVVPELQAANLTDALVQELAQEATDASENSTAPVD